MCESAVEVQAWIRHSGGTLQAVETSTPVLQKNESIPAAIVRLRQQAATLRTRLAEIERAPWPVAHARARLKAQLAAFAERGVIDVSQLLEQADGKLGLPTVQVRAPVHNAQPGALTFVEIPTSSAYWSVSIATPWKPCWIRRLRPRRSDARHH